MLCPHCGKKTSAQKLECEHCGEIVNKECPNCAEIVRVKAKKCRFCGHEFTEKIENLETPNASFSKSALPNPTHIRQKSGKRSPLLPIILSGFILIVVLYFLFTRKGGEQAIAPSNLSGNYEESSLTLTPLALQSSGPGESGWTFYDVYFVIGNRSGVWMPIAFDTGVGTVSTQEGFTYDGDPLAFTNMTPMQYGVPLLLPPDFRIVGSTDIYNGFENTAQFQFMAANESHPESIHFANYGDVNIAGLSLIDSVTNFLYTETNEGRMHYPTDQPETTFLSMGDTLQVVDKANVTFVNARVSEYGSFQGLTIDLTFQNLNAGYENSINESCYLIDGLGFIRWNIADTQFYAGPGQTTQTTLGFYLWDPTAAYNGNTDLTSEMMNALLSNAKIICNGEFQAVFNVN